MVKAEKADVVAAIGGGKAIDLGKAVLMAVGAKFASVPTTFPATMPQSVLPPSITRKTGISGAGISGPSTRIWCL